MVSPCVLSPLCTLVFPHVHIWAFSVCVDISQGDQLGLCGGKAAVWKADLMFLVKYTDSANSNEFGGEHFLLSSFTVPHYPVLINQICGGGKAIQIQPENIYIQSCKAFRVVLSCRNISLSFPWEMLCPKQRKYLEQHVQVKMTGDVLSIKRYLLLLFCFWTSRKHS